jgi:hypothetical protein
LAAKQRLEVIISLTYTPRGGVGRTISFGLGI